MFYRNVNWVPHIIFNNFDSFNPEISSKLKSINAAAKVNDKKINNEYTFGYLDLNDKFFEGPIFLKYCYLLEMTLIEHSGYLLNFFVYNKTFTDKIKISTTCSSFGSMHCLVRAINRYIDKNEDFANLKIKSNIFDIEKLDFNHFSMVINNLNVRFYRWTKSRRGDPVDYYEAFVKLPSSYEGDLYRNILSNSNLGYTLNNFKFYFEYDKEDNGNTKNNINNIYNYISEYDPTESTGDESIKLESHVKQVLMFEIAKKYDFDDHILYEILP